MSTEYHIKVEQIKEEPQWELTESNSACHETHVEIEQVEPKQEQELNSFLITQDYQINGKNYGISLQQETNDWTASSGCSGAPLLNRVPPFHHDKTDISIKNKFEKCVQTSKNGPSRQSPTKGVLKHNISKNYASKIQTTNSAASVETSKEYKCEQCSYATKRKSGLLRHVKGHHRSEEFKCHQCSYVTKAKDYLLEHIKVHYSERFNGHPCQLPTTGSGDSSWSSDESSIGVKHKLHNCTRNKNHKNKKNSRTDTISEREVTPTVSKSEPVAIPDSTTVVENKYESYSNVTIDVLSAKKCDGKRVRDKQHSCYFCHKLNQNMARHFETMHSATLEVAKILSIPKGSSSRKIAFGELIKCGDFYHNCNVLETKVGELLLVRRPTQLEVKLVSYSDFGPCPHCLGFMLKKHLWHHIKTKCSKNNRNAGEIIKNRHVVGESVAILNNTFGRSFSKEYMDNIVSSLRQDVIGQIAAEDNLIVRFGAMQYEKYGTNQNELIRQSMRQLARLKQKVKEVDSSINGVHDCIVPIKFDVVVQATKLLCLKTNSNISSRPNFGIPSLALKIGYSLRKCAAIERGIALRNEDLSRNEKINAFINLMEMEWAIRISSNALNSLYTRKMNSEQLLPITSDLINLTNYLSREIKHVKTQISSAVSPQSWANLASLTLCKIILFNKRSGETSKITLNSFYNGALWKNQATEELKNCLTPVEKKLAESHIVIEVPAKRGRKVPIIFTQDTMDCIEILNKNRKTAGISEQNPYVFARCNKSINYLRGHDCLRKHCSEANLTNPELVTGTKLQKYIATVCQVMNLEETEYDWLAHHLGHDIRVHGEFYRVHESAVELTKISRLLQVVEKGEVSRFAGQSIRDININDIPNMTDDSDESQGEDDKEDEEIVEPIPKKQILPKRKSIAPQKKMWSNEEKSAVLNFFKVNIKNGTVPGKKLCEECMENYPILKKRRWTDIKFCVKNSITKCKKMKN